MSDYKIEIDSTPFSWNDKMADIAIEDFEEIQNGLSYCIAQSIGIALAKLKKIEDGEIRMRDCNTCLYGLCGACTIHHTVPGGCNDYVFEHECIQK